jgi:hypothetical protein
MAEAKPVIKNKFWIVEEGGQKVGTIQAVEDGVVLVQGQLREKFPSFKMLTSKHNIRVGRISKKKVAANNVYDFPCDCEPYNPIFDLKSRLPLYTKDVKSKSFYCAGHYLINIEGTWTSDYCPKKIVLSRHEYHGPFKTKDELTARLSKLRS